MQASSSSGSRRTRSAGSARVDHDLRQVLASSPVDLFGNPNPDYRLPETAEVPQTAASDQQGMERPSSGSVTCPNHEANPGQKRCRHYYGTNSCARPDGLFCVEWLRANGHPVESVNTSRKALAEREVRSVSAMVVSNAQELRQALASSPLDLFGSPNPGFRPRPTEGGATLADPARSAGLTEEAVASFAAADLEVCFLVPGIGELWLVSRRTGQARSELTASDLALLACGLADFDRARAVALRTRPASEKSIASVSHRPERPALPR